MSTQFNCQKHFYFKLFSLVNSNSAKYKYRFVYTQLNVKTFLYETIQFSVSTVSMSKTVLFQTIQFSMSTQFNCQKHFYFKLFSLVKQF